MTKDELKKEAEEESFRYVLDKPWACYVEKKQIMGHFEKGYIASAEPREKRIAELEKENAELKRRLDNLFNSDCLASEKLTKAIEHIKQLLGCLKQDANDPETNYYICQYMDKAEQFLNSEVEK